MSLNLLQIFFLAALQGLTEFLPISSSGHLLLPSLLWDWPDQGLVFDVAVHVGSLVAVVWYFRVQLGELISAFGKSVTGGERTRQSTLAWLLLMATVPAGLSGLLLNDWVETYARSLPLIASTSIFFGLLLWSADRLGPREGSLVDLNWKRALLIGMAQVLALIPGTSRSGITMTAALSVNLSRHAAAQFSFLLAIPLIAASGLLKALDFFQAGATAADWLTLLFAALVSAVISWLCIHYFLRLIEKLGFLPFVIYRVLLGMGLWLIYLV